MSREKEIRERLEAKLNIIEILFEDFSQEHSGHYHPEPSHEASGASHVSLKVVSSDFTGLNRVQRSRLVYEALGDLFSQHGLHALTLKLLDSSEK